MGVIAPVDRSGVLGLNERLVEQACLPQHSRQIRVPVGVPGLETEGLAHLAHRVLRSGHPVEGKREAMPEGSVLRLEPERLLELRECVLWLRGGTQRRTELEAVF